MLVDNEFFTLFVDKGKVLLKLKKKGFPLKSFDHVTREHPRIKITSFPVLRKAFAEEGKEHIIGDYLPLIELVIARDHLQVEAYFHVTNEQFETNKEELAQQLEQMLDEKGIVFGRQSIFEQPFKQGVPIVVARGQAPVAGADAKIQYIDPPERKPVIREDGVADYYEMNFVTPIAKDQWLGEKIHPQPGIDGYDIFGQVIPSQRGKDAKLVYDRKSVYESEEEGKVVLRALHGGALEFLKGGIVSVGKQLVISGDVGPETGSISFEGAVRIHGTVMAGYSVNASGDISIEGVEGVTNAKEICSSEGDLYIKGGIFGGGLSVIEAKGDMYIKHANNCKLYAKNLHVGLYVLGSEVVAEKVYVDKNKGKIIGGKIEALYAIECAYAGNQHERRTHLVAKGMDRELVYHEIQQMAKELKELQERTAAMEQHLAQLPPSEKLSMQQKEARSKLESTLAVSQEKMAELDQAIFSGMQKIKQAVPPTIEVTRTAYPGVIIQIGQKSSTLHTPTKGVFEVIDNVLNV